MIYDNIDIIPYWDYSYYKEAGRKMKETICLALLAADRVWVEDNGKIGMVGIFENFGLMSFPAQVTPFSLYLRLGNVPQGKNTIGIDIKNEKTDIQISNMKMELEVKIDQVIMQLPIAVPPLTLPSPGDYSINLIANGKKIGQYMIHANLIPGKLK
jgi:hypothetical protein